MMKKKLKIGIVSLFCAQAVFGGFEPSSLDVSSSTLDSVGVSTLSTDFSVAQSVPVNSSGDVLVVGAYSCSVSFGLDTGYGRWKLSSGDQSSLYIQRAMSSSIDAGSCSIVHIFTNLTDESTISLEHQVSRGRQALTTKCSNLIAIPLSVSSGESLNYGIDQQAEGVQTSSKSYVDSGLGTTVDLDCSSSNGVYIAAAFNAKAIEGAEDGMWQIQYKDTTAEVWQTTGREIQRSMSDDGDIGAISLFALVEGLDPAQYEFRLVMKSVGGGLVETLNATLAVVALSYVNLNGDNHFQTFSILSDDLVPQSYLGDDCGQILDTKADFTEWSEGGSLVAMMSFGGNSGEGGGEFGEVGTFGLMLDGEESNQPTERYFEFIGDSGSIASIGAFSNISAGAHCIVGYRSDNVYAKNVTLVGFSTETIPTGELQGDGEVFDTDKDGIPDTWEALYFEGSTNAIPTAMAANGENTILEAYIAGLDPDDPEATFQLEDVTPVADDCVLSWSGVPGRVYTVYWASNLVSGFTEVLQTNIAWDVASFTDTTHGAFSEGFYKIGVDLAQ